MIRSTLSLLAPGGARARLSVLIFHRVLPRPDPLFPDEPDVARFEELMGWVARWFHVLPLDEALQGLAAGTLPARAAAITFDDGYADNLTCAVPVLRRHGLSATFFIATGFLDGGRMWNDTLIEALRATGRDAIDCRHLGLGVLRLGSTEDKRLALARLVPAVKHLEAARRADEVARIAEACAAPLPGDLMLTTAQLRALREAGMGIGAHTVTHPILKTLSRQQARAEISASREALEGLLGEPVRLFAYPNGKAGEDYLPEHVEMVRGLGFDAAVATNWGVSDAGSDRHQIPRFTPWDAGRTRFGLRLLANLRKVDRREH
jgi:peptidoglycan/xylan/chitin deacetylase (PgdA/CDA1 family)